MKKWAAVMLALSLALGLVGGAIAESESRLEYQSNFMYQLDGWYPRSAGEATLTLEGLTALIQGRSANWNSPGRDFPLVQGVPYELSVQVYQDQADSAEFMISVAHSLNGIESYENLGRGTVPREQWVTVNGAYTPGYFDKYTLYVETVDAPQIDFKIRLFRVYAPKDAPEMKEEINETEQAELPSIKDVYFGQFDFGVALPQFALGDQALMRLVKEQASIVTHENELKPDSVLNVPECKKLAEADETAVAVHFTAAQPLLDYALDNGIKVHGHVLVWHSQTPEAFFHEGYDVNKPLVSREIMLGRMENYIKAVMEYMGENYPGVIVSWDVVNEAIDDGTNQLRDSNWLKTVGDDFVNRAFEFARKYAPEGTLLYYNDYNTAIAGKLIGISKLLESLMAEGNIDGYGFQMHHSVSFPSMDMIQNAVVKIAGMGLKLRVSELDIGVDDNSDLSFQKQAKMYSQIMQLLIRYSDQVEAVQVWGVTDAMSWRSGNYPLLFNRDLSPKPAFWAVADPESVR